MDCERNHGEVLEEKPSASDNRRVIFSPGVKVINTNHEGGCGPRSEITVKETEHGSARSLDSSSSSKASCEDIVQVNSQIIPPNSIGESNIIPQPSGGSNRLEECVKECQEPISQLSDVDNVCLVKHMSPILSPSVQVMECPEDYDPDSPAYVFDSDSSIMEGNASSDDLLFSIHMGDDSFSIGDATGASADIDKSGKLPKSGQSLCVGELCQFGASSKSGKIHKTKECQSTEHLKGNESIRSGELGRFDQISPNTKGVESNKKLDMGKTVSVDVKRGEKGMVGEPVNNVREGLMNNQVDTSTRGSRDSSSKHKSDGTVAFPKKKKSSWKSCHCFEWPSCCSKFPGCSCKWIRWPNCSCKWIHWPGCSFKWFTCHGCLCERPSNQLKYPRWAGSCFKCLYWPCLKCRC